MYRIADDLARTLLQKMKTPKIHTEGERRDMFTPVDYNGLGIADPICCIGSEFNYLLESPVPIVYPELPYVKNPVDGFYLYKKIELLQPMEKWLITKALVDPTITNYEEQIDASDCSIILANSIEKLTCKTIKTLEQLIEKEPTILDCIDVNKK